VRERGRKREERERKRERGEGERERDYREVLHAYLKHFVKMLWLCIESHSNLCLYSLKTYQQARHPYCIGWPTLEDCTSAAPNLVRPLVGGLLWL
jgi:hypothetical protein